MKATVRPSVVEDCHHLAPRLRAVDRFELSLLSDRDPLDTLLHGFEHSDDPRTILAPDGEPVGMFGVVPFSPGVGVVWMLAADRFTEIETIKPFLRWCRPWVEDMQSRWPIMFNLIWTGNDTSLRWLRWCGFEFSPTRHPEILRFERRANV